MVSHPELGSNLPMGSDRESGCDIITGFIFSGYKKAYFKRLGNSFKVNPSELVFISFDFSSLLLDFSILFSFKLKTVSFKSQLEFINS